MSCFLFCQFSFIYFNAPQQVMSINSCYDGTKAVRLSLWGAMTDIDSVNKCVRRSLKSE